MDLSKIRDVIEDEALTFCLKCQFPLVLIAGKYRLESVLRKGGCSVVYVARHVHLDRDAERVIKIIRPEFFTIKGMATRFRREVQLTSALSQRNEHIVRIFDDFGEIPNIGHFYVMEYLQGSPLSSMLKDPALLPSLSFCYHLFMQLCEAMQFAHEQGVVHRDLKPDNLVLVKRKKDPYFLKVLDFGIAKPLSSEELPGTHITQGSLGTPAYMAPEQCLNQPTDARTDLYAMGIILYELLTGRTPFLPPQGEHSAYTSVVGVIEGQITTPPPPPHELRPDRVSPSMEKMLLKALAKKQKDRYQSIDEFREAFLAEVSSTPAFRKEGGSYSMDRGEVPQAFPAPREGLSTAELELVFANPDKTPKQPESDEAEATLIYGGPAQEPVLMLSPGQASIQQASLETPGATGEAVQLTEVAMDQGDDPLIAAALSEGVAGQADMAGDEEPLLLTQPKAPATPPPNRPTSSTPLFAPSSPEPEPKPTSSTPLFASSSDILPDASHDADGPDTLDEPEGDLPSGLATGKGSPTAMTSAFAVDSEDAAQAAAALPPQAPEESTIAASAALSALVDQVNIHSVDLKMTIRDEQDAPAAETLMYSQRQAKHAGLNAASPRSEPPADQVSGAFLAATEDALAPETLETADDGSSMVRQETAAYASFNVEEAAKEFGATTRAPQASPAVVLFEDQPPASPRGEGPLTLKDGDNVSVLQADQVRTIADMPAVSAAPAAGASPAKATKQATKPKVPTDRASLMELIDRVQGPRDGRVGFFLVQREAWDTDPFLVKSMRDKLSKLQAFLKSDAFQTLYPGCRGKIMIEAASFPQEVAKQLMRGNVELRLKPGLKPKQARAKAAPTNGSAAPAAVHPANGTASATPKATKQAAKAAQSSAEKPKATKPKTPAAQAPTAATARKPASAARAASGSHAAAGAASMAPAPQSKAKPAAALQAAGTAALASSAGTQSGSATSAPTSPVQGTPVPHEQELTRGPTPMAIWDGLDEHEPAYLSPQQGLTPAMMWTGVILLLSLVGVAYALLGMGSAPDPAGNLRVLSPDQVSSATQPKVSYVRVTLRPDRATFALIPVQDRKSGISEMFVLFASQENRRLLIYAPQEQSQLLTRLRRRETSDGSSLIPIWQPDLRGQGKSPEPRTYTGTLEQLQRRKHGPLELVLPDQNRNINKIPGFVRAGIQFPMDSMILLVGQKPKPPPNHHATILWMALLSAVAAGAAFFALHKRQQRAF